MSKITQEQIDKNNDFQRSGKFHPLTCCGPSEFKEECFRINNIGKDYYEKEGILISTEDCWICPCGKYKQKY